MMLCLLLLLLTGQATSDGSAGPDRRPVYRGVAPDGTVLFGDRPSTAAPRGAPVPRPLALPPTNVVQPGPATPMVRTGVTERLPTRRPAAVDGRPAADDGGPEACRRMRTSLAALWQERRHGYAPDRGPQLKAQIRDLQARMKERCGHWR